MRSLEKWSSPILERLPRVGVSGHAMALGAYV